MSNPPPIPDTQATPATRLSPAEWQLLGGATACGLVAALTSGLPSLLVLISLVMLGGSFALRHPAGLYAAVCVLGGAMLLPHFQWATSLDELWPIDLLYAISLLGMFACGLSYLEFRSSGYRSWTTKSSDGVPIPPSENDWSNPSTRNAKQSAFGQFWLMALVAFCLAVFILWWYPFEAIGPRNYRMDSWAVRLCRMFLFLFFPIWMLSSLLSIIAWQRISPLQAYVFGFRELHDEQGKELIHIEKRVKK